MSLALCLRFDLDTARAVTQIWRALSEARVSSDMLELNYPPHLSLVVATGDADPVRLADALASLTRHVPASLEITEPCTFLETEVVYLACAGGLAALHEQAAGLIDSASLDGHYRPGLWTPHVTLQTRGDADLALALAREQWRPRRAMPTAIDLVRFPPVEVLASVAIGER